MDPAQVPPNSLPPNQNPKPSTPPVVDSGTQIQKLDDLIISATMPEDLAQTARAMTARLRVVKDQVSFYTEFDTISRYITWIASLPWNKASKDILDLEHARQVLDKHHYGLGQVKDHILEYLAIMIMTRQKESAGSKDIVARSPILSLVGLAGVGKTSVSYSIAEALGRKIERIPFGGLGSASQLRGKSRLYSDSEPGMIVKALKRAGTSNPVILLDEIDRVSAEAVSDIMGVLVEVLDPAQNKAFLDHFIDYPVDLSQALFIATSNNTKNISTAVLDRLEIIQMPSYTDEEKIVIGKTYVLPQILRESGLTSEEFEIAEEVWPETIVRPLGYDPGIRGLQRVLQSIVRKTVYMILMGKIPKGQKFIVNNTNAKTFVSEW